MGEVISVLEWVQAEFNEQSSGAQVSLADLIVLGGAAAVEKAARDAGHDVTVPFTAGRTDATQEDTDVESFGSLEPRADGFRNYLRAGEKLSPETLLVDRAYLLGLGAPEMAVLVAGLRALGANAGGSSVGVLTDRPGQLTNDFFVNLLAGGTTWKASQSAENVYDITDSTSGEVRWTASAVDLVFGSNSQLRAIAEVYASAERGERTSSTTSSPPGPRSWTTTGSTCAEVLPSSGRVPENALERGVRHTTRWRGPDYQCAWALRVSARKPARRWLSSTGAFASIVTRTAASSWMSSTSSATPVWVAGSSPVTQPVPPPIRSAVRSGSTVSFEQAS